MAEREDKMNMKYFWFGLAVLFLLYAFYTFVFGLSGPSYNPNLNTLTDKVARAFISICISAAIIMYFQHYKHD